MEPPTFKDNPPVSERNTFTNERNWSLRRVHAFRNERQANQRRFSPIRGCLTGLKTRASIPSRLNSLSLQTCVFTPFVRFAAAMASSTIPCGSMLVGGVSTIATAEFSALKLMLSLFSPSLPTRLVTPPPSVPVSFPRLLSSPPRFTFHRKHRIRSHQRGLRLQNRFRGRFRGERLGVVFRRRPHVLFAISCNPCAPDVSLCLETCVGSAPIAISCTTALALFSLLLLLLLSPPFLVPVAMTTLDALSFFAPSRNASITDFVFSSMQQFSPFINSTSKTSLSAAGFPTKLRRSNSCLLSSPNNFVVFDDGIIDWDLERRSSSGPKRRRRFRLAWYRPPGPPPPPPDEDILIALKVVLLLRKERPTTTQPGVFVVTTRERRSM